MKTDRVLRSKETLPTPQRTEISQGVPFDLRAGNETLAGRGCTAPTSRQTSRELKNTFLGSVIDLSA